MAVLIWPLDIGPSGAVFRKVANTQAFVSPLSKTTQTAQFPGARWGCDVTFPTLNEQRRIDWEIFIDQLEGAAGRFYFTPPHRHLQKGVATGSPVVDGVDQIGKTLLTRGWTVSVSGILKKGDFFHVDVGLQRQLFRVAADVDSDASGNASIPVTMAIRKSPADGEAVVVNSPSCIMKLVDDKQGDVTFRRGGLAGSSLKMIEAFE